MKNSSLCLIIYHWGIYWLVWVGLWYTEVCDRYQCNSKHNNPKATSARHPDQSASEYKNIKPLPINLTSICHLWSSLFLGQNSMDWRNIITRPEPNWLHNKKTNWSYPYERYKPSINRDQGYHIPSAYIHIIIQPQ